MTWREVLAADSRRQDSSGYQATLLTETEMKTERNAGWYAAVVFHVVGAVVSGGVASYLLWWIFSK